MRIIIYIKRFMEFWITTGIKWCSTFLNVRNVVWPIDLARRPFSTTVARTHHVYFNFFWKTWKMSNIINSKLVISNFKYILMLVFWKLRSLLISSGRIYFLKSFWKVTTTISINFMTPDQFHIMNCMSSRYFFKRI